MAANRSFFGLLGVTLEGERLEERARELAARAAGRARRARFAEALHPGGDRRAILSDYKRLSACARAGVELSPAAETLLDSFYLVEKSLVALTNAGEQLRDRTLPVNREGEHVGFARAYSAAAGLVGHHGARIDDAALTRYITAFQQVSPLSMRELCALPMMLRLCTVRVVRLMSAAAARRAEEHLRARELADALCRVAWDEKRVDAILERAGLHARPACVERLTALLQERDEYRLIERMNAALRIADADAEALTGKDRLLQAQDAARMQNAIASLRFLDALDFRDFFERFSAVEAALREDAVYPEMDAATRGYYRTCVERLAGRLGVAETVVAKTAVRLARGGEGRLSHVGAYLFEEGEPLLWEALRPDRRRIRLTENQKLALFAAGEAAFTAALVALAATGGLVQCLLSLLPAWSLGRFLAVRIAMWGRDARRIPRMEFASGVPEDARTLIVVPTLILSEDAVAASLAQLETHYLANPLPNCCFAVLGDFKDGPEEWRDGEKELLAKAKEQTDALNARYAKGGPPIFFFLHRKRELSRFDGIYMGRERKRGALCDLVELIAAGEAEPFALISAPLPSSVRYCLTLDADTILPPGALAKCVGAMAHPLNRPVADRNGVVRLGHGVIAPRMRQTLASAAKTPFARLASGESGVDLYASAANEFYQDVFGTGNFGGKGIFDVAAFRAALPHWIPENSVLSHDLLEGCFLRAGFLGDIALYDGEPSTFAAWWKRQHRWMRGDWQLLPFLLPRLRDAADSPHKTPLSLLSRAKMLDNLRRTLLAPAVFNLLLLMPYFGGGAYVWVGLAALWDGFLWDALSLLGSFFVHGFRGRDAWGALRERAAAALRALLEFVTLPFAALKNGDAMGRSLWRVLVSHRNMLEWQTAAETSKKAKQQGIAGMCRLLWPCLAAGAWMAASAFFGRMPVASVLLALLFFSAPALVLGLDRPRAAETLSPAAREAVAGWAARTWRYFETFCTEETGFLPPDNFQEAPLGVTVNNTSPTNIGMAMLSAVAAHTLGLIDAAGLVLRLGRIAERVETAEKWNGHLYNWYSLAPFAPLAPRYVSTVDSGNLAACLLACESALLSLGQPEAEALGKRLRALAEGMDFRALYDPKKKLFHIGFDCVSGVLTKSWYDLLASESRLTSFVAIALHQVDAEHWQNLSRLLVDAGGGRTLISWSGTMFEYLMPVLLTGMAPGSLLCESCMAAVRAQRAAVPAETPWGISESGYYAFDRAMFYQYRAFGVHAVALSPARERERVISPYSAMLALMAEPREAAANIGRLEALGALGEYGFYEALDFTPQRLRAGVPYETVKSYMAHHQGMSLCAAANALTGGALAAHFLRVPEVRAASLLLAEKRPSLALAIRAFHSNNAPEEEPLPRRESKPRVVTRAGALPETQLITNGRYTAFLTDGGISYSRCGEIMLTRFRPDALRADSGVHFLVRDGARVWSLASAPGNAQADAYRVTLEPHKVTYERRDGSISSRLSVCVSPRHDGEVRHLLLKNDGASPCELELGVFAEIALATQAEDLAHPAFVKLTVDAKLVDGTLLFERRGKNACWAYARLCGPAKPQYATDRLAYLGRNRTYAEAMKTPMAAPETVSAPIEPGLCARTSVTLRPGESAEFTFLFGMAESERKALAEAEAMRAEAGEAFDLAWAHANSALRFAGVEQGKAALFERIAARLILGVPQGRVLPGGPCPGVPGLWKLGISGDLPIVTLRVDRHASMRMAKTLLELHAYLRARGVRFELVFLGVYPNEYAGELRLRLQDMIEACAGGDDTVHLLHDYALAEEDRAVLAALALVVIDPEKSLSRQFQTPAAREIPTPAFTPRREARGAFAPKEEALLFPNGCGGFSEAGDEYVIRLSPGESTPLPWANVLANERFGTLVTENGGGYTWCGNSREHKLTPWANDPVRDPKGEILLLYDLEDRTAWTLTQGPLSRGARTETRHGFGYTRYSSEAEELSAALTVFVDAELPVKYSLLTLRNPMLRERRVGVVYAAEWVLAGLPCPEAVRTCFDGRACYAENLREPSAAKAYIAMAGGADTVECAADREDVLAGGWARDAWDDEKTAYGTGFSALRTRLTLAPGETRTLVLLLGEDVPEEAAPLLTMDAHAAEERLEAVKALWRERLGAVRVKTPDRAMDVLLNGWLMYQTWSARVLGRTGYYQCGGAVGFRDQLQDMLSILHSDPARVRAHILLCASRQFEAGDVLHWWHPPVNGVRTRITDDRLFLPYVALAYAESTGDASIWEENAPYLEDMPILEGKRDLYCTMREGKIAEPLYLHCARAVERTLEMGAHGLPLMGGGDWNDGMDHVGDGGGESVWLGMLLLHVLTRFAPLARQRGDAERAARYDAEAARLRAALEEAGWDGAWYRRAYFGDGRSLGARGGEACAIDLIAQAWAAMCGLPHAEEAFDSAMALLSDRENGVVRLLAPPFERPDPAVGYISSYLPGVRENGGQYTHAAAWLLRAACLLNKPDKARELFSMLSPIAHGDSPFAMRRYKAEPYVLAGDVYAVGRNAGRGGWTWYTGAAGWLYEVALSDLLGVTRRGDRLFLTPCTDFPEYSVWLRFGKAAYEITVRGGARGPEEGIPLVDDGLHHSLLFEPPQPT